MPWGAAWPHTLLSQVHAWPRWRKPWSPTWRSDGQARSLCLPATLHETQAVQQARAQVLQRWGRVGQQIGPGAADRVAGR